MLTPKLSLYSTTLKRENLMDTVCRYYGAKKHEFIDSPVKQLID